MVAVNPVVAMMKSDDGLDGIRHMLQSLEWVFCPEKRLKLLFDLAYQT